MERTLQEIVLAYNAAAPLEQAATIPAEWYVDSRIAALEARTVFSANWIVAGRADQVARAGAYVTAEIAGEPVVVVRGADGVVRGFYNVCRHHAAAVMMEPCGVAQQLRCPYHGWTYGLDGTLRGTPDFEGVRDFDRERNGLVPLAADTWENLVFVNLNPAAGPLGDFLGGLRRVVQPLELSRLHFFERREYTLQCNWKVFVDNYLDGGYHVPYLHKSLASVVSYKDYTIRNEDRYCEQSSPLDPGAAIDAATAFTRRGSRTYYLWQYPNFMLNWYEGVMDTNLVIPLAVDRCRVVFDFYFTAVEGEAAERNRQSIQVSDRIQDEDVGICEAVQRGLRSRAYGAGRLSVRREGGMHLFHRLLGADLRAGLPLQGGGRAAD
jgi:choline monooxygenase